MLYYCPAHKRWEPLNEKTLADDSLCDFCCFHKPCPLGHSEEYWEEGWDEFAAEVEEEKETVAQRYKKRYERTEEKLYEAKDEDAVIVDYFDLTEG